MSLAFQTQPVKTTNLKIRVSDEQKETLLEIAQEKGFKSLSEVVRAAIDSYLN